MVEEVEEVGLEDEKDKDGAGGRGSFGPHNCLMSGLWTAVVPMYISRYHV